jgi:cytochrome c
MRNKLLLVLTASLFIAACGNNNDSKPGTPKDTVAATAPTPAADKGLELIGSNDCTACHAVHKGEGPNTGPAYEDVAAKYSPPADTTVNHLIMKIRTGGSGVWGTNVMTPHPALKEDDAKTMVNFILSLKKG